MNIVTMLKQNANVYKNKPCFIEKSKEYSYQTVLEKVAKARIKLQEIGIQNKTQVILLEPISVRLYTLMMALWSLGATVVVFDPSATNEYIQKCLERVEVDYFIGCKKAMLLKYKLKSIRKIRHFVTVDEVLKPSKHQIEIEFQTVDVEEENPALITFTSGSTGNPKVAVRTHGFLLKQYNVVVSTMNYNEDDVDLAVLPVFTLVNMARGIITVIPDESLSDIAKVNSKTLVKQLKENNVTRITTSPMLIQLIADYAVENNIVLSNMRRLNIGGGPVFPFMIKNIKGAFPNATLYLVYGSTEAEPIAEIEYETISKECLDKMQKGYGLIGGYVVDQINCKVIKNAHPNVIGNLSCEEFKKLILPNQAGEIVVSGEHVLSGYLNGIGDEENKFGVEGCRWHRTGDMGIFDDQNRLWLLGRASATIQDERGILYPFAVECAVYATFHVNRCATIQLQNQRILVVETTDKVATQIERTKQELQIDRVVRLNHIPLDIRHRSKIDYGKLRQLVGRII